MAWAQYKRTMGLSHTVEYSAALAIYSCSFVGVKVFRNAYKQKCPCVMYF